jgi:hypothetical protein
MTPSVAGFVTWRRGLRAVTQEVWALDLATHVWEQLTPTGTPPPGAGWSDPPGDRAVMFGGITPASLVDNTTYALSLGAAPAWSRLT